MAPYNSDGLDKPSMCAHFLLTTTVADTWSNLKAVYRVVTQTELAESATVIKAPSAPSGMSKRWHISETFDVRVI